MALLPYRSPMLDANGFLVNVWAMWYRQLYKRLGGPLALTNEQLEQVQGQNLTVLQSDVETLKLSQTAQDVKIAALKVNINDLSVGPNL